MRRLVTLPSYFHSRARSLTLSRSVVNRQIAQAATIPLWQKGSRGPKTVYLSGFDFMSQKRNILTKPEHALTQTKPEHALTQTIINYTSRMKFLISLKQETPS